MNKEIKILLNTIIIITTFVGNGICQTDSSIAFPNHRIEKMIGKMYDEEKKDSVVQCYFIYDSLGRLVKEMESPLCIINYEYDGNSRKISKKNISCGESRSNGEYIFTYPNDTTTIMEFAGSNNDFMEKKVSNSKGKVLYTKYLDSIVDYNFQPERKIFIDTRHTYSNIDSLPQTELETVISKRNEIDYKSGNKVESTWGEVQIYRFYSEFDSIIELRKVEMNAEIKYLYKYDPISHKKTDIEYFEKDPYNYTHTHIEYDKNGNIYMEWTVGYCKFQTESGGNSQLKDGTKFSKEKEFAKILSTNIYKDGRLTATMLCDPCKKSLTEWIKYSYKYFD